MSKEPLMKYACIECGNEFITQVQIKEVERNLVCPFPYCQSEVQVVVSTSEDNMDLYEELGGQIKECQQLNASLVKKILKNRTTL
ncbi:hypothetical protein ACWF7H_02890 [Peribacillus butanolivorans]|uniref:hypothetical protein n=1 Tax=Peribacillus butanolivorans TaxID=421767 RepID=UPI0036833199